jgi:predicted CXXCH cytochrome family protein
MTRRKGKRLSSPPRPLAVTPISPEALAVGAASGNLQRRLWLAVGLVAVASIAVGAWMFTTQRYAGPAEVVSGAPPPIAATYVDDEKCGACHTEAMQAWRGTHHQRAMQEVSAATVLGDFSGKPFTHRGATTTFSRRDDKYFVTTEGPDGKSHEYAVKYTFGVAPLQQYLVATDGGRLQALTVAWNSEQKHWFTLHPQSRPKPDDPMHSLGRYQNWNMMCSECHSTDLHRNYDAQKDSYDTHWAALSVGCQACHGPGSAHLAWAAKAAVSTSAGAGTQIPDAHTLGLVVDFRGNDSRYQVDTCAPCHSRRQRLTDGEQPGKPFLDNYRPALLREGLYYPDGQQLDEVYVWGSFLQSRMYARGVRCTDCHNPHSLQLKAQGNALCEQCHTAAGNPRFPTLAKKDYDTPAHHHHAEGSPGAQCVNCHIPARNYMVINARPDHSFRIPRPDISVKIGTPNACNGCHDTKMAQWAADAVARWYGPGRRQEALFGEVFAAARAGSPDALAGLSHIVSDPAQPAIVRASALELARNYGAPGGRLGVQAKNDTDALVRAASAEALAALEPDERVRYAAPLLRDPVKLVRLEAARALAEVRPSQVPEADRASYDQAWRELIASESLLADMPTMQMNLGGLAWQHADPVAAEAAYRKAVVLDPYLAPAYAALATFLSTGGRNPEAEQVLRDGVQRVPGSAELHSTLALLLAEEHQDQAALAEMTAAARLPPPRARVFYNLGLLQQRAGDLRAAATSLAKARALGDMDATHALALLEITQNRPDRALPLVRELVAANPGNAQFARMLEQVQKAAPQKPAPAKAGTPADKVR